MCAEGATPLGGGGTCVNLVCAKYDQGPVAPGRLLCKLVYAEFTQGLRRVYARFTQVYAEFTHGLRSSVAARKPSI